MKRLARTLILLAALPMIDCACGDEPIGANDAAPGADATNNDGATRVDTGQPDPDGGDGNDGGPGGDTGMEDGGPQMQPRSEFCEGEGTIVIVGGDDECAGEIAERTFRLGLCTCEDASVQSQLTIDAFDSELGPYGENLGGGMDNVFERGHLGVNGLLDTDGKVTIKGNTFVAGGGLSVGADSEFTGLVFANGSSTQANSRSHIVQNAYIDGDVTGRFEIDGDLTVPVGATVDQSTIDQLGGTLQRRTVRATNPCRCEQDQILNIAGLVEFGRTFNDNEIVGVVTSTTFAMGDGPNSITLPCGRYYLTEVNHSGTLTIRAEGRTVLYVAGDFRVDGSLSLELEPDAEMDLFIVGSLSIGASARLGEQDRPAGVRTYVGGSDPVTLIASSEFGGNVYAPRAEVTFGGSAEIFGALFARRAVFGGSADIHYDLAVTRADDDCEEDPPPTDGGVDSGPGDGGEVDTGAGDGAVDPPTGCTECFECFNGEGCVIPEGETSGTCGPCQSDLDCCAPNVCVAGVCQPNI